MSSRIERSTDEPGSDRPGSDRPGSDRPSSDRHGTAARDRFEQLCAPYRTDLLRFLIWLCRDRALAEDVMQETLLRAWRSFDALADTGAVRAWLLTIARRELARVFERKRLPTVDLDTALATHDGALTTGDGQEIEDMRRAIFQLETTYREPLVMQVLLGLSTEEISRQLSISVPAVLTRLYRARELLRECMGAAEKGS